MKRNKKLKGTRHKQAPPKQGVLERIYDNRYIMWLILLAIISVIYHNDSLEAFINYRFLVYTIFLSAYAVFFFWMSFKKTVFLKSALTRSFFIAGLIFSLWAVISSFFSMSHYETLYPIAKISVTGLSIFFIMESLSVKNALSQSFKALTLLTLFHAFVPLMQVADIGFTSLPGGWAPYGFMGHRNLLGGFLAACLCFPAYLAIKSKGAWRWISVLALFLTMLAIIFSQTRTAWITSFIVLLLMPSGWLFIHGWSAFKSIVKPLVIGVAGLVLVGAITFFSNEELRESIGRRLETIVEMDMQGAEKDAESGSLVFRIQNWKRTIQMAKDYPITGVGLDNWKLMIPLYGNSVYIVKTGKNIRVRPHNIYLKILSETGFIGFFFFLSLLGVILWGTFNFLRSDQNTEDKILTLFLGIGFFAFLMDMLPSFSVSRIEHSILFAFIMGGILSIFEKNSPNERKIKIPQKTLWLTALIILCYSLTIAVSKFEFGKQSKIIREIKDTKNFQAVIKAVENGKSRFIKLDHLTESFELYSAIAYRELKDYENAFKEGEIAMKYNPNSAKTLNTVGTLYLMESNFEEGLKYFNKASQVTPLDNSIKKNQAVCYYFVGDYQKTVDILQSFDYQDSDYFRQLYQNASNKVYGGQ